MHNAMCKTKNGVPSVKSVSVMAGGGAAVGTEPCREDSQAVPPQEKDRCQWERDGVPAPLFFGQTDLKGKKNKRACISPSGENHEKWRIHRWTLYLLCIFVYNYAYLINKRG